MNGSNKRNSLFYAIKFASGEIDLFCLLGKYVAIKQDFTFSRDSLNLRVRTFSISGELVN